MYQSYNQNAPSGTIALGREQALVQPFMRRVYNWMAVGLGLSALVAWFSMNSPSVKQALVNPVTHSPSMLFWGLVIAELALVMSLSAGIRRIRVGTATFLFVAYAALNGVTLGLVLMAYTTASVAKAFLVTAGTFALTSIWASTTKKDLSSWGSFLTMGLIGIVLASLVNIFFQSPMVDWVVSILGVGIFVGLTAYDTQKMRAMVLEAANETTVSKMAILGALSLYLDFLNLFLMLLRLMGDRR